LRRLMLIAAAFVAAGSAEAKDSFTVAAGPAVAPRYEGSDDYRVIAAGAIRGTVSGVSFITQGTALFVDLVPDREGPGTKFSFGPMAHVSLNRSSLKSTRDPQIVALGRIPVAVELGGHVGVTRTGLITSDFDSLNLDVAISHDVTGIHDGLIVTPSVTYGTPLSRKVYVGASISASYVGRGYAQTYFGVTPAQSLASGLPAYRPDAGFKDVNFGALTNISLSGDLRRGLSAFAIGNYAKLVTDAGRSPVVRNRAQWFGAIGLAYTF
jgi:MipA family protein